MAKIFLEVLLLIIEKADLCSRKGRGLNTTTFLFFMRLGCWAGLFIIYPHTARKDHGE